MIDHVAWTAGRRALLKAVDRYLIATFLSLFLGVSALLTGALLLLDLLSQSEALLDGAGGDWNAVLRYARLRAPAIATQFSAPAGLLAAMGAFAALNQRSELIVMRAVGVSPGRLLRPLVQAGAALALAHLLIVDTIVVEDRQALERWRAAGFGAELERPDDVDAPLWLSVEDAVVKAKSFTQEDGVFTLRNLTIYEKSATGQLTARIEAARGTFEKGVWILRQAERFEGEDMTLEAEDALIWRTAATPALFLNTLSDPDEMTMAALVADITQLEAQDADAPDLRTQLLHRAAASAALALMPCLGAIVAFGAPRRNPLLLRAAGGMALGFVYFVAENVMVALGEIGATPPAVAAFAPLVAFSVVGAAVMLYGDEHVTGRRRAARAFARMEGAEPG